MTASTASRHDTRELTDRFLTAAGLPREETDTRRLAAALGAHLEQGRAAWPQLEVDPGLLVEHLARCTAGQEGHPLDLLERVRSVDIYLACACALGVQGAAPIFEQTHGGDIKAALVRRNLAGDLDEVRQRLMSRLLVGQGDRGPALARYSGQGRLRNWVCTAAVRTALDLARTRGRRGEVNEERFMDALDLPGMDPELDHLKHLYRGHFKDSLHQALRDRPPRERALLKFTVIDGLTSDELGRVFQVHRATASRWLASAMDNLEQLTRRELMARLEISVADYQSLMRLINSQLNGSLTRVLRENQD